MKKPYEGTKCIKIKAIIIFILGNLSFFPAYTFADQYITDNKNCDGYQHVLVGTMKGSCLGLVAQASQGYGFIKPRKIIQIPHSKKFLITDMGGWKENRGTLWLLDTKLSPPSLIPVLKHLNLPHGLAIDNQGRFYLGEKHRIIRFTLDKHGRNKNITPVIQNLPSWRGHRHPLTEFIFDHQNNLIVNTAAPSDQCKRNDNKDKACTEFRQNNTDNASLRKYIYNKKTDTWGKQYTLLATGLRNSMALSLHSSGTLLQAENNMDFEGLHTPFEEINIIKNGRFYGWPYCYDKNTTNPFWKTSAKKYCLSSKKYQMPWVVIAPHSAPLDMMYYNGKMFPNLTGKLILSWHGYRSTGQRIVSYSVDSMGRPLRIRNATYSVYRNNSALPSIKRKFPESQYASQATEVIHSWNPLTGYRPKGRPVGMTVADDGAIWIVDDVNKAILRLAKGTAYKNLFIENINSKGVKVNNNVVADLFKQHCSSCHTNLIKNNGIALPLSWLAKIENNKYNVETRLFNSNFPRMPPEKMLTTNELSLFKKWFSQYRQLQLNRL